MKHLFAILCSLLLAVAPVKAINIDSWKNYFSYYDATDVVEADGVIYSIMSGNLISYDLKTEEVRYIDRITSGLSYKGIQLMGYSTTQHTLVIVYYDGNIDLYDVDHDHVTNLPQFRDTPDADFALNNLIVQGDEALLSTNEGIIIISVKDNIIKGRYPIGKTSAAIFHDGRVYAALTTRQEKQGSVICIDKNDNLLDRSHWRTVMDIPVVDMSVNGDYLYLLCPYNEYTNGNTAVAPGSVYVHGVWAIHNDDEPKKITVAYPSHIRSDYGRTIAYGKSSDGKFFIIEIDGQRPESYVRVDATTTYNCIYPAKQGGYWTTLTNEGITHYALSEGSFKADGYSLNGGGPLYEIPFYLQFFDDQLFMSPGRVDPSDLDGRPFHVSYYDSERDEWGEFEIPYGGNAGAGPWLRKNHPFESVTAVAQDPKDPSHYFVTSHRQGLFEYRDGKLIKQYTEERHMDANKRILGSSVIKSCSDTSLSYDYVRTAGAVYDKNGNLFFANNGGALPVDTCIWCLTPQGKFLPFYFSKIANATAFEKSIIGSKGRLWFGQRRTAGDINGGFLCMDFNGTLENTKDDKYTYRTEFYNQDGTLFTFQQGIAIAEDRTGRIWLGTETGLIVVDDPDKWGDTDFTVTQVKVPRNDGTNYADYLLAGSPITTIAVDGADRKWIGTNGDGVYLVSADGIVTIHHFTSKNSPLPSDYILSIACHPKNGEVFIGTEKGLVSYQSDASSPEVELTRDNLRVYPNPVRPDYSGPIVLDGLVYDSDIEVVNAAGHTVAGGTSVGGTFTWNGRGPSGERVGSGVYYFLITTPDGKKSTVAKVAVIR